MFLIRQCRITDITDIKVPFFNPQRGNAVASGYVATVNGYIRLQGGGVGNANASLDGQLVYQNDIASTARNYTIIFPIKKGQKLTFAGQVSAAYIFY